MNYEEKYNEILEWARKNKARLNGVPIEEVLPELRESKDERIRKKMLEHFRSKTKETWCNMPVKDIIAYLEKQKEHKPAELKEDTQLLAGDYAISHYEQGKTYSSIEVHKMLADAFIAGKSYQKPAEWTLPKDFEEAVYKVANFISPFDSQEELRKVSHRFAEQLLSLAKKELDKPAECSKATINGEPIPTENYSVDIPLAEWSYDWREEDIQTRFAFYTYKDDPSELYLSNVFVEEASRNHGFGTRILRAAEKVAETIGATTICLKVKQNSPANAWYRKNGYGYVAFEDGYDWLEKNLEYMKPNKQEWSEEDEKMKERLITRLTWITHNTRTDGTSPNITFFDEIDWLKSLRPQYHGDVTMTEAYKMGLEAGKASSWKPSEDELGRKHLEGYIMGREDTMREMKDFIESHFNCENAKKGTPIVYNTQSGTSTLKAEG